MIRILQIIPTLDRSGSEKQLTLLATRLPREQFNVHVCALTRGGPYEQPLREAGVPVTVLGKRLRLDPLAFWRLERLLAAGSFHIVHTWLFAANSYGRLAARCCGVPALVVSERCADEWKSLAEHLIDRLLIGWTDRIIVNSHGVADYYAKHGVPAQKLKVIYNGIELEPLRAVERVQLRRRLGVPAEAFVLGFVGRLWPQKRVQDLIWVSELLRNVFDLYTFIVGDGPERRRLEGMVRTLRLQSRIRFLGLRDDVAELLQAIDLFVLPSCYEGLPNAAMEAMWAGLPVVATDIPGTNELVVHGQTGYLVPVGDTMAMAQTIRLLLRDDQLRWRMGQAGHERIRMRFGAERMVQEHVQVYLELAEQKGLLDAAFAGSEPSGGPAAGPEATVFRGDSPCRSS